MSFRGLRSSNRWQIKIGVSETRVAVYCENATKLKIEGITFTADEQLKNLSVLKLVNCSKVSLSFLTFQGKGVSSVQGFLARNHSF